MKPRRDYWSPVARAIWLVPVWLILVPVIKLLELFGVWPKIMARGMAKRWQEMPRYEPSAHDVMVCSYFKSGTNWTMQLVTQVAYRGRGEYDHIHDVVPWIEFPANFNYAIPASDENSWRNSPTGLRAVKTHLPMKALTFSPETRYVWVVRDPKDVFVSGYHFIKSVALGPATPTVQHWLELFFSDYPFNGSWAEHLAGGWALRNEPNLLFLTFDQMKRDPEGTVAKVAELMGVELSADEHAAVVERSSYKYMKAHSRQFDTRGLSPPWATPRGAMVRRGESGSAEEFLSAADQERIDTFCRAELKRLGCDFPYDEHFVNHHRH